MPLVTSTHLSKLSLWLATALAVALAAGAGGAAGATRTTCSSFGPSWAHTYDLAASKAGNPVRILAACCHPAATFGVNSCLVTVTLVGTRDRGCELVDIGKTGVPVGAGKHENCSSST
jgi:hypothetical protein